MTTIHRAPEGEGVTLITGFEILGPNRVSARGTLGLALLDVTITFHLTLLTGNVPFSIRVGAVSHSGRTSPSALCLLVAESIPRNFLKGSVKSRIFRC